MPQRACRAVASCLSTTNPSIPSSLPCCSRPVLLSGEPGLRKEHLAALIHYSSPNRELPLVKIDCQATQDIAAVLFGPDGSEADGSSSGLLCSLAATGGTLLLNNVHVVSLAD